MRRPADTTYGRAMTVFERIESRARDRLSRRSWTSDWRSSSSPVCVVTVATAEASDELHEPLAHDLLTAAIVARRSPCDGGIRWRD